MEIMHLGEILLVTSVTQNYIRKTARQSLLIVNVMPSTRISGLNPRRLHHNVPVWYRSYCFNERQITADKTQWLIHLTKHREDIIKTLCDVSDSRLFCVYLPNFMDKRQTTFHYRSEHEKVHYSVEYYIDYQ